MKMVHFQLSWDSLSFGLEVKSKMSFFSERQNYFEEKNHSLFAFLLGASCMQKARGKKSEKAKLSFQASPKKFDFA